MKDKHSPLPWTLGEYNSIRAHGMRPGDKILVSGVSLPMSMNEEAEANSRFIVECVNRAPAFDALLVALADLESAVVHEDPSGLNAGPRLSRALEKSKAALQLARGSK